MVNLFSFPPFIGLRKGLEVRVAKGSLTYTFLPFVTLKMVLFSNLEAKGGLLPWTFLGPQIAPERTTDQNHQPTPQK